MARKTKRNVPIRNLPTGCVVTTNRSGHTIHYAYDIDDQCIGHFYTLQEAIDAVTAHAKI